MSLLLYVTLQVFPLRKWTKKIVKVGRTSFILSTVSSKNIDFLKSYEKSKSLVKKRVKKGLKKDLKNGKVLLKARWINI